MRLGNKRWDKKKETRILNNIVGDSPMTRIMDLPKENINQELSWQSGEQQYQL